MLDVTNAPAVEAPAAETPAAPAVHAHFSRCIHDFTIAELVAEWRRLWKFDETDEYGDCGDCRFDRISEIEDLLARKRAKSAEDVLQKWTALELIECTDNQYFKTIAEAFEWDEDGAKVTFEKGRMQELFSSIIRDLHDLTKHPDGSWCTCNDKTEEDETAATIEPETVVEVVDPSVFRDGTKEGDLAIVREGSDDVTLELLLVHKEAGLIKQLCAPAAVRVAERFTKAA
jgi:hypothetical protein